MSNTPKNIPFVYDENSDKIELPWKLEICCDCDGRGTSSAYLGAFTASEWAEQDFDFKEDYIAGRYDRTCKTCDGLGMEAVVDETRCKPELLKRYYDRLDQEAEDEQYRRMESGYYRGY